MGWADIAHEGKSLHIAFGDIDAAMFQGFQGREGWGKLWVGSDWGSYPHIIYADNLKSICQDKFWEKN